MFSVVPFRSLRYNKTMDKLQFSRSLGIKLRVWHAVWPV